MLSGENQTSRRPGNRELENIICSSQQNEINEQEHWKPLWLRQHWVQKTNSSPFSEAKRKGRHTEPRAYEMSFLTHWEWGVSFLKEFLIPQGPSLYSWSRNLPCSAGPGTLVCSVSMDQTQQIDLTTVIMPCECLKWGVGCGALSMPVGPISALVLGSGCSDSLPSDRWGNYCLLSVDSYMRFADALAKPCYWRGGFL